MSQNHNPYEAPRTKNTLIPEDKESNFKQISWGVVIVVGFFIPGLVYWSIRRDRKGLLIFLSLILAIPIAFIIFGPLWGDFLFKGTPYSEWGLYPFIAVSIIVLVISLVISIRLRARL